MLNKGSKAYSILKFKCPKCHQGDMYPTSILSFRKWFVMNDRCSVCGQPFELEPGFYWGAMYVAYGVSSLIMFAMFAIFFFAFNLEMTPAFFASVVILFFLYPFIFRMARSIWINIYVHYTKP